MLKSITTLFAESGLNEAPYMDTDDNQSLAERAAAMVLGLGTDDDGNYDTTPIATYAQETAIDGMAIVLPRILDSIGYDRDMAYLPVIDDGALRIFRKLAEETAMRIELEYGDRGQALKTNRVPGIVETIHEFCVQYVKLCRKACCIGDYVCPTITALMRDAARTGQADVTLEELLDADCLPTDVPWFSLNDVKAAIAEYHEKRTAAAHGGSGKD